MPHLLVSRHSVPGHAWILSTNVGSRVEVMDTLRTFYVTCLGDQLTPQILEFPSDVRRLCRSMVSYSRAMLRSS